jgi:hypothetical protein
MRWYAKEIYQKYWKQEVDFFIFQELFQEEIETTTSFIKLTIQQLQYIVLFCVSSPPAVTVYIFIPLNMTRHT